MKLVIQSNIPDTASKEITISFAKLFVNAEYSELRKILSDNFYNQIPQIREKYGDRAVLRAHHFFKENARVKKLVKALLDNVFNNATSNEPAAAKTAFVIILFLCSLNCLISSSVSLPCFVSFEKMWFSLSPSESNNPTLFLLYKFDMIVSIDSIDWLSVKPCFKLLSFSRNNSFLSTKWHFSSNSTSCFFAFVNCAITSLM